MTDNFRASLLMVFSMAAFALEDLCLKLAAADLPAGQIMLWMGVAGVVIFGPANLLRGRRLFAPDLLSRTFLLRNVSELAAMTTGVLALTLIPLSLASSILQAAPILVTLGAAIFLRETVGWRRWSAIAVGLVGVLMILKPGTAAFTPAMLLSFAGVVALAARDLATRLTPRTISTPVIVFWGYVLTILGGVILMAAQPVAIVMPRGPALAYLVATFLLGVAGYFALLVSLRSGEASAVVPFRYSRIVFALILGMAVLGERPDGLTLAGCGIVIAAGLFTMLREAQLRRRARAAKASPLAAAQL